MVKKVEVISDSDDDAPVMVSKKDAKATFKD